MTSPANQHSADVDEARPTPHADAPAPPVGVVLRPANPEDLDPIRALEGLGRSTRSLLPLDLAGAKPRHTAVAVDTAGTVVGFAISTRQPDEVHVLDIAVAPSHRRGGIARSLLARLATLAVADGVTAMTLEVRVSNHAAQSLYAGCGFDDHGIRPGYYQDGEDAVILWHHDLPALASSSAFETNSRPRAVTVPPAASPALDAVGSTSAR